MKNSDFLTPAPENYIWPQCPEADSFICERIDAFLSGHVFAKKLRERMKEETSTEFGAWVDHILLPKTEADETLLKKLGFVKDSKNAFFWHPLADLPRILVTSKAGSPGCAIMVENISDFLLAQGLSLPISGAPLSPYREARLAGEKSELRMIERRGTRAVIPDNKDRAGRYTTGLEMWLNRPRVFASTEKGMKHTFNLAKSLVQSLGTDQAAWVFLEAERRYWERRNSAARIQKARQDKLGLGWANHDHHTFRSSRPAFPALINILKIFGFKKRERYYAGAEAGWGAQILEQPNARLIIFADVDLTSEEIAIDFTRTALPELGKPGTIGLWCALHGESMLEAGMHHLEAKFNFEQLKTSLKDSGVNFMAPFSDFPHLRQAFSEGELWPVRMERLDALKNSGRLSQDAYDRIKQKGAVGSHMENLQRRNGFKGFNQKGVSSIIREVNPETQAMKGTIGRAS